MKNRIIYSIISYLLWVRPLKLYRFDNTEQIRHECLCVDPL